MPTIWVTLICSKCGKTIEIRKESKIEAWCNSHIESVKMERFDGK